MITNACRNAENWTEKDIIYIVGIVESTKLKHLCMVYGEDYCADEKYYLRIKNTIKKGVENIQGVKFSETKELGRVNKVDPLGKTYLRVRGMWGIENPWTVFSKIYERDFSCSFNFMAIINEQKWNSFANVQDLLNLQNDRLKIFNIKIPNPNNPEKSKSAKLITYYVE